MAFIGGLLNFLIVLCSIFLICLVLIQRGRGGGLAGAFGGLGGSSAFGTRAGDVFTRVTVVTAVIWFLLAMALVIVNNRGRTSAFDLGTAGASSRQVAPTQEGTPSGAAPSGTSSATDTAPTGTTTGQAAPGASTPAPTPAPSGDAGLPPALTDEPTDNAPAPPTANGGGEGTSKTAP